MPTGRPDRCLTAPFPEDSCSWMFNVRNAYDDAGRLISASREPARSVRDGDETRLFQYDRFGRLVKTVVHSAQFSESFCHEYDGNGNRIKEVHFIIGRGRDDDNETEADFIIFNYIRVD